LTTALESNSHHTTSEEIQALLNEEKGLKEEIRKLSAANRAAQDWMQNAAKQYKVALTQLEDSDTRNTQLLAEIARYVKNRPIMFTSLL
jgi:chromosome segregation ATPase